MIPASIPSGVHALTPRPLPSWAPSRLSSLSRIAIGALLLATGGLVAAAGIRVQSLGRGSTIPGSVERTWVVENFGRTSTMAEFHWNDESGEAHVGLTRIADDAVASLPTGAAVGVYSVRVGSEVEATIEAGVPFKRSEGGRQLALGIAISLAGLFFVLRAGIADARTRSLLSNGTMVVGQVTAARQRGSRIHYDFEAQGAAHHGASNLTAKHKRSLAASPREGDAAYVVFDPENPGRSAIWGFSRARTSAFADL